MSSRPCLPGPLKPSASEAGQTCPQKMSGGGLTWTAKRDPDTGCQRRCPQAMALQSQAQSATVSSCFLIWAQRGQFSGWLYPARIPDRDSPAYPILILDDFNADGGQSRPLAVVCGSDSTALVCLELADCMGGSSEKQGRSPRHAYPWSQTPPHLGSRHHSCSSPALRGCPALIPPPSHLPAGPWH